MNEQELQKLTTELQNGNAQQRRAASYKLGKSKNPSAVSTLINAYNDTDSSVRQNVIDGLKNIGSPEALEFLKSKMTTPSVAGGEISKGIEEIPETTEEVTILEIKQHRGILVLLTLIIPLLFGLSTIFWSGVEDGTALGCFWFIALGAAFYCIYLVLNYRAKKPELKVTNKRIIRFTGGTTKEGLITDITKVTVQDLVHLGSNHFGNLTIQFKGKPAMQFGGLPDPINFAEKLKSAGVPANKINVIYWQTATMFVMFVTLLFYVYVLYALFYALFIR